MVALVTRETGKDCGETEEETLGTADPGDVGVGVAVQEGGVIVGLVNAEGVYETPLGEY